MANIGSSPLGLTFYSTSDSARKSSIKGYALLGAKEIKNTGDGALYKSLFGNSGFSAFPNQISTGSTSSDGRVLSNKSPNQYHSNDIYDTSVTSLISYTRNYSAMKLLAADFAYLKDFGVYPNNRLMVARRFAGPVKDDLTSYGKGGPVPLSTLISWTPDGNDFISISFGEEWDNAEASFKDVLNDIGKDMKASADQGTGLGNVAGAAFNAIPLPGFMEGLQYKVLQNMGLSDDKSISGLPGGNPNLIREAKVRKTLKEGESGSGLKADVSITMKVDYEQKFINGVDPTLVYFDIISNILSFGTSEASFQFSGAFGAGISKTLQQFISGDIKGIMNGIKEFLSSLISAIAEVGRELIEKLVNPPKNEGTPNADTLYEAFSDIFKGTIGATIGKYKIRIQGIANALSGAYSTPWHITVGNPKKPLFSSADMYTTDVKLTLGPILAFNDLPSSISVEFTLKNARNLGAQEIYNKFNSSGGRTYKRLNLSFAETKLIAPTDASKYNLDKNTSASQFDEIQITGSDVIDRDDENISEADVIQSQRDAATREGSSGIVSGSSVTETTASEPQIDTGLNNVPVSE